MAVVAHDDDRALEELQPVEEPFDRLDVEVVRRLVEDEHVVLKEEELAEEQARALAARQRLDRLERLIPLEEEASEDAADLLLRALRVPRVEPLERRRPRWTCARAPRGGPARSSRRTCRDPSAPRPCRAAACPSSVSSSSPWKPPTISLSSVDFPMPFGPMTAILSPRFTFRPRSSIDRPSAPNALLTLSMRTTSRPLGFSNSNRMKGRTRLELLRRPWSR